MANRLRRGGWWRLIGRIMIAATLTLALAITCAIIFGPQLGDVVSGTAFGPTLPQSPLTGVYARATVDSVHVTRTQDQNDLLPAFDKAVTNAATTQALYNAAFALPAYPSGTINCPLGADITYHLAFTRHGIPALTITIDGCFLVSLGSLGDRLADGRYFQTLASALRMSEDAMWSPRYTHD